METSALQSKKAESTSESLCGVMFDCGGEGKPSRSEDLQQVLGSEGQRMDGVQQLGVCPQPCAGQVGLSHVEVVI